MTPERIQTLIDSYGADPARWPADERSAATAMLNSDAALAAALNFDLKLARDLDASLQSLDVPALDARAAARLLERMSERILERILERKGKHAGEHVGEQVSAHLDARVGATTASPIERGAHTHWRMHVTRPLLAAAASLLLGFGLGSSGMTSSLDAALVALNNEEDSAAAMEVSMAAFTTAASAASAETMLGTNEMRMSTGGVAP